MTSTDSIPDRFDYNEAEPRLFAEWERSGHFHSEPDPSRKPYTIVIPPPNVTGALHLGHALNNTLQDILIRMKRMQGYNALWMPGTDHAGIATQAVVEKRLREEEKLTRHDLGREKLVERIWKWKDQYEARILSQLKQMGASCDWQRTRFTLDPVCARAVRQTFFDLFGKGLIYRGKRLVNWDTFLQTAVSDDEVFHEEVKGHFWHIRYPVVDPQPGEPDHVIVATTRPETMLGDTAVAVHPDPALALNRAEAELLEKLERSPAKEREEVQSAIDAIRQRREERLSQLETLRDMARAGRKILLPLLNREIPLVVDFWAKPELGSGCVKITPAHDPNDYEVARRCDLPMINLLTPDGRLNSNAGSYQGLTMAEGRKRVVADLESQGRLAEVEDRVIDLAHSDRSKTPIEPYLADQWFVKMEELAQSAMDAVSDGRVKIAPQRYAKGYLDWLAEKRDWPVSRQLWWGHQIPVWSRPASTSEEGDALSTRMAELEAAWPGRMKWRIDLDEQRQDALRRGLSEEEVAGLKRPHATVHICIQEHAPELEAEVEKSGFVRSEEVLDTWFSSALWPHSTLGWPEKSPELAYYYPTSVLVTSRDIITLWVARMVLTGLNNVGDVPFREVFIHPKILDGYGETMSKSKGNGVDPFDIISKFGADALRFGLAQVAAETQDVRMPVQFECPHCQALIDQTQKNRTLPRVNCTHCNQAFSTQWASKAEDLALPRGAVVSERFEVGRNFMNKLWNASRFALLNLADYTPGLVTVEELSVEDRWILSRLTTVTKQATEALESYHYAVAARILYDFAWDEFCSFYIEMVKGRLQDSTEGQVARRVLAFVLDSLLRLLHPMMPFLTEEVWQLLGKRAPERGLAEINAAAASIMVAPWPRPDEAFLDEAIEARFAEFQKTLGAVREIRSRQNIPPKKTVHFSIRCDAALAEKLVPMTPYFARMANATFTEIGPDAAPPQTHAKAALTNADVYVDLAGLIDPAAERAKLRKQEEQLVKQIDAKEKKLSNASFVERAPPQVVLSERESLSEAKRQLESIRAALQNLGSA